MGRDRANITTRFALVAIVSVVIAGAIVMGRSIFENPLSRELRARVPLVNLEKPKNPEVNAKYVADRARLLNEMGRRPSSQWSVEDTSWLVDLLQSEPNQQLVQAEPELSDEEASQASRFAMDQYTIHISSLLVVSTHLKLDAPLPEEVVGAFEARVVADLGHWQDKYRRFAIACIKDAGWLDRPDIRPLIEELRENDPDESIRNLARRSLLFADGMPIEDLDDDCPTCPDKASLTGGG